MFEKHLVVDGRPVPGGIFDFALYFFHNVKELLARGSGPYFYLPKMQSHLEARLWNDVFLDAQVRAGANANPVFTCIDQGLGPRVQKPRSPPYVPPCCTFSDVSRPAQC